MKKRLPKILFILWVAVVVFFLGSLFGGDKEYDRGYKEGYDKCWIMFTNQLWTQYQMAVKLNAP